MTLTALYTATTFVALGLILIAYAAILARLELGDDNWESRP